jgi:hypothetical protein
VLKNSFQAISATKFVRKLLNVRWPQTLKFTEITSLVPFSTPTPVYINYPQAPREGLTEITSGRSRRQRAGLTAGNRRKKQVYQQVLTARDEWVHSLWETAAVLEGIGLLA